MPPLEEIPPLPFGPVAIAALLLIAGFVTLVLLQAVRRGDRFEISIRDYLAFFITVIFAAALIYTFFGRQPEQTDILIGALIAAFTTVIGWFFRSDNDRGGDKPPRE
jgi:uncharacterized membrane protein